MWRSQIVPLPGLSQQLLGFFLPKCLVCCSCNLQAGAGHLCTLSSRCWAAVVPVHTGLAFPKFGLCEEVAGRECWENIPHGPSQRGIPTKRKQSKRNHAAHADFQPWETMHCRAFSHINIVREERDRRGAWNTWFFFRTGGLSDCLLQKACDILCWAR